MGPERRPLSPSRLRRVNRLSAGEAIAGYRLTGASGTLAASRAAPGLAYAVGRLPEIRRYLPRVAVVIAAYYGAAHLGYAFRFAGPVASIVWLPVGVGIAGLYLLGPAYWPGVVIGDLLVNNYSALPVASTVGQSFGNLLEVVLAAMLLRRFARRGRLRGSFRGLLRFLAAITGATAVSATVGLLSLRAGGVVATGAVPHLWLIWWLGDLCGALIVVPLAIVWIPLPERPWFHGHGLELAAMLLTLVVLSGVALQAGRPLSYLSFPALTWAALRFGGRGATLAVLIGATFTVIGTTDYLGPFSYESISRSLLDTQLYLVVSTMSTLGFVALAQEREQLAERLRASRSRVVAAADAERRRIERDLHDGAQQRLVVLSARLGLAACEPLPAAAAELLEAAQADLGRAIDELRELVHGLRPEALRQFGLGPAVELVAARSVTPIELTGFPAGRLDDTAENTAYYVVLEALTNAERHAHASIIRVRARLAASWLDLQIEDDGVGGAVEREDLGLQGLRDRVESTGGSLEVESRPGSGTRISARIPVTSSGPGLSLKPAADDRQWRGTEARLSPAGLHPRGSQAPAS